MRSLWYEFIDEYKDQIPYKPLSIILEAFYWYIQMESSDENDDNLKAFIGNCHERINALMR